MDKTYKITSNKVQLDVMYDRTVRQTKQLNDKVSNWQSRSGGSLDYNFVPDGRGTTNIWGGYGHLQEDLNACITNVFYPDSPAEWYRDEWNYRWGIPSRAITRVPVKLTQLTLQFNNRNSDNNGSDGYGIELYGGLGSYGTTKLVSDMDAWYPHNAYQFKSYSIGNNNWFDHFMLIVSCRGVSYHDRVGYRNVMFYGQIATQEIIDISSQGKTAKEEVVLIPTQKS